MSVPQAQAQAPDPGSLTPSHGGEPGVELGVAAELQRVVERWRQLPLDHALSYAARVRALVQSLADGVAQARGVPPSAVPDLGPATLMDQLGVMVYDASTAATTSTLAEDLASLRRELR